MRSPRVLCDVIPGTLSRPSGHWTRSLSSAMAVFPSTLHSARARYTPIKHSRGDVISFFEKKTSPAEFSRLCSQAAEGWSLPDSATAVKESCWRSWRIRVRRRSIRRRLSKYRISAKSLTDGGGVAEGAFLGRVGPKTRSGLPGQVALDSHFG